MYEGIDESALRDYILNKFTAEGDFDFLKEGELPAIVDAMRGFDGTYENSLGLALGTADDVQQARSEERRVGKECRSRWSPYH